MIRRHRFKTVVRALWARLGGWSSGRVVHAAASEPPPLRAELFSADQLEQHGKTLARRHVLDGFGPRDILLARLAANEAVLAATRGLLSEAVQARIAISPAGEWLLDNYYLIEEQIRTARKHLPKDYCRELPRLAKGPSRGLPRVYDLALEAISHGDGRIDAESLERFVAAYQSVAPLSLGELWAIPIMLRLALIENLRRVAARINANRALVNQAQEWADRMMEIAEFDPKSLILVIADMARSNPPMQSAFVAELVRRLQGHGPALALPLTWIEQRLAESSQTVEQLVLAETGQQAADQMSISNSIGSLRFLGTMDWRVFVESMSVVEQILREDLGNIYRQMDFATRDRYRHVIDRMAKRSALSEAQIAREAIQLAHRNAASHGRSDHTTHVGYYLIDAGLTQLEEAVMASTHFVERLCRWIGRVPLLFHIGGIGVITALFSAALLDPLADQGVAGWQLVLFGVLTVIATSQLASTLANWFATLLTDPKLLPRMDYSEGIPPSARTLVVVPTMLDSAAGVADLIEAIEVRFLGNQDAQLHFALLTDFVDHEHAMRADDERLLQAAGSGIEALNQKYSGADGKPNRFFLFHRPRRWNAADRIWMGYERKRGKLSDLNALLRGHGHDRFMLIVGDLDDLADTRYVITLDTDTQLPRDCARGLVGAMAHALNCPRLDPQQLRIIGGYGILQPRMAASLATANPSIYANLCGSEPGIDPYTRSVSDVYQDLFAEGSFIGKGIYDIDAFEATLGSRFPENRILSHDLLEGCHARSGLISDVELYEAYPARYRDDVKRQQRWIRGDWQIARWLLPSVPAAAGKILRNPISALSRWKIFDNLRRSLVPAALLLLLLLGWLLVPDARAWTWLMVGIVVLPPILVSVVELLRWPRASVFRNHLGTLADAAVRNLALAVFRIATLPFEALYTLDSIAVTLWRLLVTQRGLLEWQVAASNKPTPSAAPAEVRRGVGHGLTDVYRWMWIAPALAAAIGAVLYWSRPSAFEVAAPLLLLWMLAPALAWWLSRPLLRRVSRLSTVQSEFLQRTARKTWAYFERFVVADDNWLPPDNFQEDPGPIIAHRTSPTNIGLALLSNLGAHDFGYISTGRLLLRSAQTFDTMARMERHRGHFFNWYDTQTLLPLAPRYISAVDSGNLAGHLLTLRAGLLTLTDQPVASARLFDGLADALAVLTTAAGAEVPTASAQLLVRLDEIRQHPPANLPALAHALTELAALVDALDVTASARNGEVTFWIAAVKAQYQDARSDLADLAPWLQLGSASADVGPAPVEAGVATAASMPGVRNIPNLRGLLKQNSDALDAIASRMRAPIDPPELQWLSGLQAALTRSSNRALQRIAQCAALAQQATEFATIDFAFLYDRARHLLAIGYNVDEYRRDTGCYDLLASEARLCSFVAIAQSQIPQENWFALGRLRTPIGGAPILVSWSGSIFEYLMPMLVMPSYPGTLLDQTCQEAVARQIAYGRQRGLPWGVSESGYNTFDTSLNYQYHAFGVPGLGLKRGLADDLVVAPYASALALMVAPEDACANLQRLAELGLEGPLGFYEAVDYTPTRLPRGQTSVIVRSYMAHHQGMSLLALAHLLLDRPMQRRFASDRLFQSALLLLQERIPRNATFDKRSLDQADDISRSDVMVPSLLAPMPATTPAPEVHLLSNGRYHVMVSNSGGGYSRWHDLAVSRWREDGTTDCWGMFIYLRDVATSAFWSATHQPTLKKAQSYEAIFSEARAEYRRRDQDYETFCEIVVSPEDDIELRRLRITNRSRTRRTIEFTSYAEVVLAAPAADAMQPAFGNLFVQTEIIGDRHAIVCSRRPRSAGDATPWMFHLLAAHGAEIEEVSYETDRMQFISRGQTLATPRAMGMPALSGSQGSVLDPIVAIRCRVTLDGEQSAMLDLVTGAADSRAACLLLIQKYQDRHLADRVFDLAWTHCGVALRQLNVTESEAQIYRRLAGMVIYANDNLRADSSVLMQNRRGQSGLWAYAISGDLPIVLLKIAHSEHIELARQLIQCHAYWRLKGLAVDLIIWNEDHVSYRQQLQDQILALIATGASANSMDRPGGIFVRSAELISSEDRVLMMAAARVIISDSQGSLADQVGRRALSEKRVARLTPARPQRLDAGGGFEPALDERVLDNGLGGFNASGDEYIITTRAGAMTPLPWVNVLANPGFGSVLSESGLAYTWSENAHEFRLTPWHNDAVGAASGEAIYLRDEDSGHYWSPSALPCPSAAPHVTRHGFGYSVFEHSEGGIHSELWVYVDLVDSVKFSVLKVRNDSGRQRRLSATGYVEWVLGDLRSKHAMHVVTEIDASSGALFARNAYNTEFGGRVAFFDVDDATRTLSGDRAEFLGRNGNLAAPDAMTRARLSGRLGAGLDPCGAIQVSFDLAHGQSHEVIFRLGVGRDPAQTRKLALRLRQAGSARNALDRVRQYWQHTLGAVQIETPDTQLNLLANGWLVYQTLACRLWARSGFYQSGGAFGFRDQLQDTMALVHTQPALLRAQILLCAGRQFVEGDVQHWWHPPHGRGVRTRCSDDFLWLPLATCRYVTSSGDRSLLDETVGFLESRSLNPNEESLYDLPIHSMQTASLYQHCVRAIEHGLNFGARGLPLMGSGDWNDGMNLVGIEGRGESVWLGFFLHHVLLQFVSVAQSQGDAVFAERCRSEAERLRQNIEQHGWDGAWYLRAWFDDGQPLGAASNSECRIDSIAQSWSVLSGAGSATRAQQAMDALDQLLVHRDQGLVQLLTPPFDTSALNPGYIKGYVPGVRENGGQYTHAAIWAAMAFSELGDSVRAWELMDLINPLRHTMNAQAVSVYKAEPYVVAADVYAVAPHVGRGGWSWYTGSAGWLYRLIVESLLGLRRQGDRLDVQPCLHPEWDSYRINYRFGTTHYQINVVRDDAVAGTAPTPLRLDGHDQPDSGFVLINDGQTHQVEVRVRGRTAIAPTAIASPPEPAMVS